MNETQKLTKSEVDAFLADLSALTQKHGIEIGGCGCCGSPWLTKIAPEQRNGGYAIEGDNERLTFVGADV